MAWELVQHADLPWPSGLELPLPPGVLRYGIGPAGAGADGPVGTLLLPLRLGRRGAAGQG